MWTTIKHEITSEMIPQTPGVSRRVWFLDAIQVDEQGARSRSNIVNGDESYCRRYLEQAQGGLFDHNEREEVDA